MANNLRNDEYKKGVMGVFACQLIWGVLPLYWQSLVPIESWKIVLYRIVTMFIFSYIVARMRHSREEILAPLRDPKLVGRYFLSGVFLTANWSIYIWAMTTGRMVQTSIGYYIEPLVICAFGVIFFKERFTKYNVTALVLSFIAIIIILLHFGELPSVALGLAFSWAIYSAMKKSSKLPAMIELVYETSFFAIIALGVIIYIETKGIGALALNVPGKYAMLLLSGLFTVIPVGLFGISTKRVSLFLVGLAQYINPSMTLVFGVFLFGEPMDMVQLLAFAIIWIGLIFFTIGEFRSSRQMRSDDGANNGKEIVK